MEHSLKPLPDTDLKDFERIVAAHEAAVRAFVAVRIDGQGQRALWGREASWMTGAIVLWLLQARECCGSMRLPSQ